MNIKEITSIGKREENQDSFFSKIFEEEHMAAAAVCDGVGSFKESSLCSQFITGSLEKFFEEQKGSFGELSLEELELLFYSKIKEIHNKLLYIAKEQGVSYGSTLTLFVQIENTYIVLQVGDSRCYLYQAGSLRQITKDQTLAEKEKAAGISDDLDNHKGSVLLQCLGHGQAEPALYDGILENRFSVLLCTDGLINHLSSKEISKVLKDDKDAVTKLNILSDMSRRAGEEDNITAILIEN